MESGLKAQRLFGRLRVACLGCKRGEEEDRTVRVKRRVTGVRESCIFVRVYCMGWLDEGNKDV
jgi:hypothetical protein